MRKTVIVTVTALILAGCGADPADPTTTLPSTTTQIETTTTTQPTTTTTIATTTATLPGEPVDNGPRRGDKLMVAGVRCDDVLNIRSAPGAAQTIVGAIPPTETGVEALGETRDLAGTVWTRVRHGTVEGWASMRFLGYPGGVEDGTAWVVDQLHEYPTADTMREVGRIIADVFASQDPSVTSRIVQVTVASEDVMGEVVYDVVGYADDSIMGVRLHVFAQKVSDGYSFHSVEVMYICLRGVEAGVCS